MKRITIKKKRRETVADPVAPDPKRDPTVAEDAPAPVDEIPHDAQPVIEVRCIEEDDRLEEEVDTPELDQGKPTAPEDDNSEPEWLTVILSQEEWLANVFQQFEDRMTKMDSTIKEKSDTERLAAAQAEMIQTNSRRIRELQDEEYRQTILLPLLNEFIDVIDTLHTERTNAPSEGTASEYHKRYYNLLDFLDEQFSKTLKRYGIIPLPVAEPGSLFDPGSQRVVKVEHVSAPANNIVTRTARRGYMNGEKLYRTAEVVVQKTTQT